MLNLCRLCTCRYDVHIQEKDCPHILTELASLRMNPAQLAQARKLVGARVRAPFLVDQPPMTVQAATPEGLVIVDGVRGEFQPHWFQETLP